MKTTANYILPLAFCILFGLAGCDTVVDVPAPAHTPRLALRYTLSNQVPGRDYRYVFAERQLFVSSSQGVLQTKQLKGRPDATVELFDAAGSLVERYRPSYFQGYGYFHNIDSTYLLGQGYYAATLGFAGQPGQTYTLRASAPGLEPVESTLTLPAPAVIPGASFVDRTSNPNDPNNPAKTGRLSLTVQDNAATADYYVATARVLDQQGNFWGRVRYDYNSPDNDTDFQVGRFMLSETGGYYENLNPYADTDGNGQLLSLGADVALQFEGIYDPNTGVPAPGYIEVTVSTITRETYNYYKSLSRYNDSNGNPFAEPAPVVGNIQNGYGLFGGSADATYSIKLF